MATKIKAEAEEPVSRKVSDTRAVIAFRGGEYEVSTQALKSSRVQLDIRNADEDLKAFDRAIDAVFLGNMREYMGRIPEEDGTVNPYGCSNEALMALVVEAIGFAAKN